MSEKIIQFQGTFTVKMLEDGGSAVALALSAIIGAWGEMLQAIEAEENLQAAGSFSVESVENTGDE